MGCFYCKRCNTNFSGSSENKHVCDPEDVLAFEHATTASKEAAVFEYEWFNFLSTNLGKFCVFLANRSITRTDNSLST